MNQDSETRTRPPRLRSRLRQVTCEAILAAAEETLAERGVEDAGMVEIAARAGVSVGTLYNHFKDREALLTELLALRRAELVARIDAAVADSAGAPFRAQLTSVTAAFFAHVEAHRRLLQIVFGDDRLRRFPRPSKGSPPVEIHRRLEKLMKLGVREGALGRDGVALHVEVFMAVLRGVLAHDGDVRRKGAESAASPELCVRFFLDGAGGRP